MVYIGGSVCIVDWSPYTAWEKCGIATYAFGKSTLYSFEVLPLIKEALQYQSPTLLTIDLRPFQYTDSQSESAIGYEPCLSLAWCMPDFSPNRLKILEDAYVYSTNKTEKDTRFSFYFDFIRTRGRWPYINGDSFLYAIPGIKKSDTKGYLFIPKHEAIKLPVNSGITDELPVSNLAGQNLLELLSYLKNINQKAVFVVAPYAESEIERKQYNYLSRIIQENGFTYINANDYYSDMEIDETHDFYNVNHTNIFGAEKYTKFLAKYLVGHYALPDRRSDDRYFEWDEGYQVWIEKSDAVKRKIEKLIFNENDDQLTSESWQVKQP